jgi:hypothetical protein
MNDLKAALLSRFFMKYTVTERDFIFEVYGRILENRQKRILVSLISYAKNTQNISILLWRRPA